MRTLTRDQPSAWVIDFGAWYGTSAGYCSIASLRGPSTPGAPCCYVCFGATLGSDCHFYPASRVWAPWNLVCADHVAAADGVEIYNPSPIQIDTHVILSQDCYLCGATHDYNDPDFPLIAYRMHIERYAWICARASVAPGIHVAEGAVLGMGAVATRDLKPWTVYSGNPAVAIRERTRTIPLEDTQTVPAGGDA